MPASILVNQATRPAGVTGRARSDGVVSQLVTCTNSTVEGSYLWTLVDVPIRSALTRGTTGFASSFTFTPDVKGTYRVTLQVNGSVATADNAKTYLAIVTSGGKTLGWRYQANNETTEDNEVYGGLGFPGNINPRGWATNMDRIMEAIETSVWETQNAINTHSGLVSRVVLTDATTGRINASLLPASGGGITELTGDVLAGPGSGAQASIIAGLQNIPLNALAPNASDVLTFNGSEWVPAAPSAGGTVGPSTCIYVDPAGSDITGTRGDASKPFQTIAAAFAATGITADDCIVLSAGVHTLAATPTPPNVASISVIGYGRDVTRINCSFGAGLFALNNTHALQTRLSCIGFTIAGNTMGTSISVDGELGNGNYMLGGVELRNLRFTKNGTPNATGFSVGFCSRLVIEDVIVENSCTIDTCIGAPSSVVLASVIDGLTVVGNLTYAWDDDAAAGLASPLVRTEVELRDVKVGTILLDGQPHVTFDRACVATNITSLNPLGVSATDVAVLFTFRGTIPAVSGGGNGFNLTGAQAILDDTGMGGGLQQSFIFEGVIIGTAVGFAVERVASANGRSGLYIFNLTKGSFNVVSSGEGVDASVLGWQGGSFNPGVQLVTSGSGTLTPGSIILNGVLAVGLGNNSVSYGFTAASAPNFVLLGPQTNAAGFYVSSKGATLVQIYNPAAGAATCDVQVSWTNGG